MTLRGWVRRRQCGWRSLLWIVTGRGTFDGHCWQPEWEVWHWWCRHCGKVRFMR